jgi:CIC family chloride channel protein
VPALRSLYVDRRRQALVIAAVVVGAGTGLLVAAFDKLTAGVMLEHLFDAPLAIQAAAPVVGLAVAALSLRWIAGGANPATADAYVENFHDRTHPLPQRPVVGRIVASIATLGSGGAMGFEGPSIYLGAAFGSAVQNRFRRFLRADETKSLLVAGAAGGVAAIFKAPATGVLFALESPYQDDIARHGLIPALVAAATSYLTYVALLGTRPLLSLTTAGAGFSGVDLFGAAVVGLAAGFGARGFAWVMRQAKHTAAAMPAIVRVALFGAGSAALAVLSHHLFGDTLTIGPGYRTFAWIADPHRAIWLIAALFALRLVATGCTVAGGGAGGMFIPLVIEGAVLGRLVAAVFAAAGLPAGGHPATATSLFTILGIAAFLGAGYRTPLAGVMFVAETTGKAVFVVPGLIAAAVSQLLMARSSVSPAQLASAPATWRVASSCRSAQRCWRMCSRSRPTRRWRSSCRTTSCSTASVPPRCSTTVVTSATACCGTPRPCPARSGTTAWSPRSCARTSRSRRWVGDSARRSQRWTASTWTGSPCSTAPARSSARSAGRRSSSWTS